MSSEPLVLDTHVWLKFVAGVALSKRASATLARAIRGERRVFIPAISLWEIARLVTVGKVKLAEDPARWFDRALTAVDGEVVALTSAIALTAARSSCHGDPADRLIMATAIELDAILVTRDAAILEHAAASKRALRVLEA